MLGRVIKCRKDKGYAFIRADDDSNIYFCHFSKVDDGMLEIGYHVSFVIGFDYKNDRPYAKNVQIVDSWYRSYK